MRFETYGLQEGLPELLVNDLIEDRYGFVWVATQRGFARFDGTTFQNYPQGEIDPTLPVFLSLDEAPNGDIWAGSWNGLVHYDRQTGDVRHYLAQPGPERGLSEHMVFLVAALADGRIAAFTTNRITEGAERTARCLDLFDPATDTFTPVRTDLPSDRIRGLRCDPLLLSLAWFYGPAVGDRQGGLWIGTEDGLYRLAPGQTTLPITLPPSQRPYPAADYARLDTLLRARPPLGALTRIGNDADLTATFDLTEPTTLLLVGMGELNWSRAADVGWLEDARGDTLWAMNLLRSAWAGGRRSNKLVVNTLTLPAGRYRLRYRSDDSWSFGDWRSEHAPPLRPAWWGLQATTLPPGATNLLATTGPRQPTPTAPPYSTALLEGRDGTIWIGTRRGELYRFDPAAGSQTHLEFFRPDPVGLHPAHVRALYEDERGNIWVGTWGRGLYRVNPRTRSVRRFQFSAHLDPETWPNVDRVRTIASDSDGTMWVGTEAGLVHLDPRTGGLNIYGRRFEANAPPGIRIMKVLRGQDGTVWVSTARAGLARLDSKAHAIRILTHVEGESYDLPPRRPEGMVEEPNGVVWVGSDRGLMYYDPATGTLTTPDLGALGAELDRRSELLLPEPNGDLWILSRERRELHRYTPGTDTWTTFTSPSEGPVPVVSPLLYKTHGAYWFATGGNGLFRFDPESGSFTPYPFRSAPHTSGRDGNRIRPLISDTLNQREIFTLYKARDGRLWIGTDEGGLNRFDPATGTFASYHNLQGGLVHVQTIAERGDGYLWLGGFGLSRFDPATGEHVRVELTSGNNLSIWALVPDERGYLWASTDRGLLHYDPDRGTSRLYGGEYGLGSLYGYLQVSNGQTLIRTREGLAVIELDALAPETRPPHVVLESLTADGRGETRTLPLLERTAVALPHDRNDLAIAFVGLDYDAPEAVTYAYRLDGYDERWQEVGTQRTARYPNLPPGRYTFRVRARNADGYWSDPAQPGASFALAVHPPWWQTAWARLLAALSLVAGIAVGAWRFKRRAEARAVELEATVAERTAELRAEKGRTERQAARLAELDTAKSRFFANVSHELRTPLTLLLGPLRDALSRSDAQEALPARHLPAMYRSAERLLTLVDELLDLARLDAGRLRLRVSEHELVALTRRTVLAFASRAEREGLALAFDTDRERIEAWVDAERYERVVSNLLTNAFKFTPSGGRVRATLDVEGDLEKGGAAVLTVRDTGEGIGEDLLPHVFERFRQGDDATTRRHEGAGIGLALVRELVELHGGSVSVESEVGFGSAFTVRLPLGKEHVEAEALARGGAVDVPVVSSMDGAEDIVQEMSDAVPDVLDGEDSHVVRTDATVLVVENHDDMRAYLRDLLASHYHVEEAEDGQAGLDAARCLAAEGRAPDLVISDVMMPGLDGYALCHALKEDDALGHVPVVLLTARADEESKLEGLSEGADDYLSKPFSAEELLARCENLIEVRRRLRARFSGEVVVKPTDVVVEREEADWLEEVKAICEPRLSDPNFGVDWLAGELGVSARTLRRRMKAASGLTPGAFLRTLRLERAAQLLEQGAGSVAEVAKAVGYTDPEGFSRAFRQGFGVAPSTYAERTEQLGGAGSNRPF